MADLFASKRQRVCPTCQGTGGVPLRHPVMDLIIARIAEERQLDIADLKSRRRPTLAAREARDEFCAEARQHGKSWRQIADFLGLFDSSSAARSAQRHEAGLVLRANRGASPAPPASGG